MPRLTRQLRRTAVILAGLYLAGVGLLAGILPPRPYVEFRVRLTEDRHYELVGVSPDGSMLATCQGQFGLDGHPVQLTEPDTVWLWDLADVARHGAAPVPF